MFNRLEKWLINFLVVENVVSRNNMRKTGLIAKPGIFRFVQIEREGEC